MKKNLSDLKKYEFNYWQFVKDKLQVFEFIKPLNLNEVKTNFLNDFEKGNFISPIFKYKDISFDVSSVIDDLKIIKDNFNSLLDSDYSEIINIYNKEIEENILFLDKLQSRDSEDFSYLLTSMYGKPSNETFSKAKKCLDSLDFNANKNKYSKISEEAKLIIEEELKTRNFNWEVKVLDLSSKMAVNSSNKTISINENAQFSDDEIKRLIVHEIDTHVLRAFNGSNQNLLIFNHGINYMETEEGLAIYSEDQSNLLSAEDLAKYCIRVIATYKSFDLSFSELFELVYSLNKNTSQSFDITARVKRGLIDTSIKGGFTKDQVYFSGYLKVKNQEIDLIKKLYSGKVSLEQIDILNNFIDSKKIRYPNWLK